MMILKDGTVNVITQTHIPTYTLMIFETSLDPHLTSNR